MSVHGDLARGRDVDHGVNSRQEQASRIVTAIGAADRNGAGPYFLLNMPRLGHLQFGCVPVRQPAVDPKTGIEIVAKEPPHRRSFIRRKKVQPEIGCTNGVSLLDDQQALAFKARHAAGETESQKQAQQRKHCCFNRSNALVSRFRRAGGTAVTYSITKFETYHHPEKHGDRDHYRPSRWIHLFPRIRPVSLVLRSSPDQERNQKVLYATICHKDEAAFNPNGFILLASPEFLLRPSGDSCFGQRPSGTAIPSWSCLAANWPDPSRKTATYA